MSQAVWEYNDVLVERVVDGDTYEIYWRPTPEDDFKRRKLRLFGVNTPEKRGETKEIGTMITEIVAQMIEGKTVTIVAYAIDSFGRYLADVFVDGLHLSMWLLENNYAVVYKR